MAGGMLKSGLILRRSQIALKRLSTELFEGKISSTLVYWKKVHGAGELARIRLENDFMGICLRKERHE
jgi:hypothetical protein